MMSWFVSEPKAVCISTTDSWRCTCVSSSLRTEHSIASSSLMRDFTLSVGMCAGIFAKLDVALCCLAGMWAIT